MCAPYHMIARTNPSGDPINEGKKAGAPPPPDRVNDQEVTPQTDRQRLADQAKADYDSQDIDINWRTRKPSKDDPHEIRWNRMMSGGPKKGRPGRWESSDHDRYQLKLNPDGSPALGHEKAYYDNLDNWYSKDEWDSFFGGGSTPDSSANDDGVNI